MRKLGDFYSQSPWSAVFSFRDNRCSARSYLLFATVSQTVISGLTTGVFYSGYSAWHFGYIDPEIRSGYITATRLVSNAVSGFFLFFANMVDAICEDGVVTSVIIAAKSGLYAISAKAFVDCTGDGNLCAMAGAPFARGDDEGKTSRELDVHALQGRLVKLGAFLPNYQEA